jgi:hypothetical protein
MPGAEDDSRFAGSVPGFAAEADYGPGWTSGALGGFQTNSIEQARLQNWF